MSSCGRETAGKREERSAENLGNAVERPHPLGRQKTAVEREGTDLVNPPRLEEDDHVLNIAFEAGSLWRSGLDCATGLEQESEVLRNGRGTVCAGVDALWREGLW